MITIQHKQRMGLVFLGICLLYLLIIARLVMLQVIERDFYGSLGDRQYIATITHVPPRAIIYDRHRTALALNRTYPSGCIFPKTLRHTSVVTDFLTTHFPAAADRLTKQKNASFMYIQRRLTDEQQRLIIESGIDDIYILDEIGRYYPFPCLAPVIGITTLDQNGACGLEFQYDEQLKGAPTNYSVQRDARNSRHCYFAKIATSQGKEGVELVTTIDSTLQFFAYEELVNTLKQFNATEGGVIIMDPSCGDILAMVTYPDFDPNSTYNLDMSTTKNRIVTETYEFGSVIKVFLTLAALDEGVVTPETPIDCHNVKEIVLDGMKLSTWKAHGVIPFAEVISGSNNIGTAQVARKLGPALYEHYRRCGFGTSTHLFIGEQAGHVTHPSTWSLQSYASLSYGYEIRATLLQLACAWCMIARNGTRVYPRLVLSQEQPKPNSSEEQLYKPEIIEQLCNILEKTVQHGTARHAQIKGYKILGKTGSAKLCIDGRYSDEHSLYTFAGIVKKNEYQRVIVTYVKEAKGTRLFASTVAAPLFERIAERMLIHEGVL